MVQTNRRSALRTVGALGTALLAGCSSPFDSSPDPGALVVQNDHSLPHTVDIAVVDGPETAAAVELRLSGTFPIEPGERKVYDEFLSDPGTYVIEVALGEQTERVEYRPMVESGRVLRVSVSDSGRLDWAVAAV